MSQNQTVVQRDRREAFYDSLVKEFGPKFGTHEPFAMRVGLELIFTCDMMHQIVTRDFANYGLSKSTYNILMLLHHGPEIGMQLHELGDLLLVSRANITGLIDHLEQKGLVTRTVDAVDRRARYARLTPSACTLLDRIAPAHNQNMDRLLQELTGAEKEVLLTLLRKTRESMARQCQDGASSSSLKVKTNKD